MMRQTIVSASMVLVLGAVALACKSGGVGDPCIPNDEFYPGYSGATETGAQIEDRSFQCETRVCLVKHFRGRVSCPYGNLEGRGRKPITNPSFNPIDDDEGAECKVPGTDITVTANVPSQCASRVDQVYCSCRCAGADKAAKYCDCPDGFKCEKATTPLDPDLMDPNDKYCIKASDTWTDGTECTEGGCHDDEDGKRCPFKHNFY